MIKVKFFSSHNLSSLEESINYFIDDTVKVKDIIYQMSSDEEWYTVMIMYS